VASPRTRRWPRGSGLSSTTRGDGMGGPRRPRPDRRRRSRRAMTTQSSLPSGSASTTQVTSGPCPMSTAPRPPSPYQAGDEGAPCPPHERDARSKLDPVLAGLGLRHPEEERPATARPGAGRDAGGPISTSSWSSSSTAAAQRPRPRSGRAARGGSGVDGDVEQVWARCPAGAGSVRIAGPFSVTATVCTQWAAPGAVGGHDRPASRQGRRCRRYRTDTIHRLDRRTRSAEDTRLPAPAGRRRWARRRGLCRMAVPMPWPT
jgi:hypothetical protein